jgi:hypothetical protein
MADTAAYQAEGEPYQAEGEPYQAEQGAYQVDIVTDGPWMLDSCPLLQPLLAIGKAILPLIFSYFILWFQIIFLFL